MIYYVSTRACAHTLAPLILYYRGDLSNLVRFVPYDDLQLLAGISSGVVVWTDMDRLNTSEREDAIAICQSISRTGIRQLNDPASSLQRFDLMRRLFEAGVNRFNVYRLPDAECVQLFPAFIRAESGVAKKQPQLHHDLRELRAAILGLQSEAMNDDLMIVEWLNTGSPDGHFRKYGAYRVDDRIYAQHILFGDSWFVKNPDPTGEPDLLDEHLEYFNSNPHADELMRLFSVAQIEYGRIDYCVVDGRIQVFEINTNPAVLNDPPTAFDILDNGPYADRHAQALLALPGASRAEDLSDPAQEKIGKVHDSVIASLRRKYRRRRTKLTIRRCFGRARRLFT